MDGGVIDLACVTKTWLGQVEGLTLSSRCRLGFDIQHQLQVHSWEGCLIRPTLWVE